MVRRELAVEERQALGKLAEVLGSYDTGWKDDAWQLVNLGERYGLELTPFLKLLNESRTGLWSSLHHWEAYPQHRQRLLFMLLEQAFENGIIQSFLADVIEEYLSGPRVNTIVSGSGEWRPFRRALLILGYELTRGKNLFDRETVVILPIEGGPERREVVSRLRTVLKVNHENVHAPLLGAYEATTRGSEDGDRQACDSLRNAFENLVRNLTSSFVPQPEEKVGELTQRLAVLSPSSSRRKLFKALYRFLSTRGPHAQEQPSRTDVSLAIRMTEDAFTWMLKSQGEW